MLNLKRFTVEELHDMKSGASKQPGHLNHICKSVNIISTFLALSRIFTVMFPVPGPISRTVSVLLIAA